MTSPVHSISLGYLYCDLWQPLTAWRLHNRASGGFAAETEIHWRITTYETQTLQLPVACRDRSHAEREGGPLAESGCTRNERRVYPGPLRDIRLCAKHQWRGHLARTAD